MKNGRTSNPVECITPSEEEDVTDTKPPNMRVFQLAEIPAITETVEVRDEDDTSSNVLSETSTVNTVNCSDSNVIIIECCYLFVQKQILPKEVEKLFQDNEVFEGVSDFQRTVTGTNKFKGVYLVSFPSEEFARNCVEIDVERPTMGKLVCSS